MNRLITLGLMFGNLVPVDSPALVERYNRGLKHLTGKQTKLKEFHIDLSGYSPEVGDELKDDLYLNPNGMNRQFILLTTAQKDAPLLNAKFSTSRTILTRFITENEAQLFALTARDAVTGELENTVFKLTSPAQLMEMRQVRVSADTAGQVVKSTEKMEGLIARFRTEEDAWCDDALIAEMTELAKTTGDITRNPVTLREQTFDQGNFWTAHFGGVYLFPKVRYPAAISVGPKETLGRIPIDYVFDLGDRNQIAKFLEINELAEPIVHARGTDAAAILRQKMDFILVDFAARAGVSPGLGTRRELRTIATTLAADLPPEFHGLAAMLRWAEAGGPWPRLNSEHPAYFYTLRASPGPDRDLVNMLLAELSPLDIRQCFICHKELFYRLYSGWTEAKKDYVANFLASEYQMDRVGTREAIFGPEPDMAGHAPDLIAEVGPWGAVRKERR
ncbi:MAG TPA: hypothetical protein PK450_02095 [Paracoccaceae bacterium]|nr:hypothetical protein [Paracoccaceae bacterium]